MTSATYLHDDTGIDIVETNFRPDSMLWTCKKMVGFVCLSNTYGKVKRQREGKTNRQ